MKHKLLIAILFLCLAACNDHRLLHNLSESNASRLVGRLQRDGIDAEKILQADGRWTVSVPNRVAGQSLRILTEERLLPDRIREVPQAAGMFASQEAQQLAYERAIGFQTEEMLLGIEGVIDARVSLRLPPKNASLRHYESDHKTETASAAVLILSRDTAAIENEELKLLVSRAVGVSPTSVHLINRILPVTLQESQAEIEKGISPLPARSTAYQEYVLAFFVALLLLGVCLWRQKNKTGQRILGKRELFERRA